jgi:hypothetical protein
MREADMQVAKGILGVALLGSALLAAAAAPGSTPRGGHVDLFLTPNNDGIHGPIVVTGAIGDYGQTLSTDKNGEPKANGDYVKVTLRKGTFEMDATALNAKAEQEQPRVEKATCSFLFSSKGQVTLSNGTGRYKGINGTASVTITIAWVGARYRAGKHKGQCNLSESGQPIAQYTSITGAGTVEFS